MKAFQGWLKEWGALDLMIDSKYMVGLYALYDKSLLQLPGTFWGFVQGGLCRVNTMILHDGMYFACARKADIAPYANARVMVIHSEWFQGLTQYGGPLEAKGRLKYIDRCSDTLLVAPLLKGDPCLNHLHFPEGIDQTPHTHPSPRVGMVVRGRGECVADGKVYPLVPGLIFNIPTHGLHKFRTLNGESMDVVAFHPDSDWGPTHEEHPMINRTWVDGKKLDNTQGVHQEAQIITGR